MFMCSSMHRPSIHSISESSVVFLTLANETISYYIQVRLGKACTWDYVKSWCQSAHVSVFSVIHHFVTRFPVLRILEQGSQSILKFRKENLKVSSTAEERDSRPTCSSLRNVPSSILWAYNTYPGCRDASSLCRSRHGEFCWSQT